MRWYGVETTNGHERKVAGAILSRARYAGLDPWIGAAEVPMRSEMRTVRRRSGEVRELRRVPVCPGYVFVQMVMGEGTSAIVRRTPGVRGFVADGEGPVAMGDADMARVQARADYRDRAPAWTEGRAVRDREGAAARPGGIGMGRGSETGRAVLPLYGGETSGDVGDTEIEEG